MSPRRVPPWTPNRKSNSDNSPIANTDCDHMWRHADGTIRIDHMDSRSGDYYGPDKDELEDDDE